MFVRRKRFIFNFFCFILEYFKFSTTFHPVCVQWIINVIHWQAWKQDIMNRWKQLEFLVKPVHLQIL